MKENSLDNSFWNIRYQNNQTGWDLGEISNPIKKWFDNQENKKINILKSGVIIGFKGKKYTTKPCLSSLIPVPDFKERTQKIRDERHGPTSWISITLKEGKFRQVRKMTAAVGYPTLRLVRIRIGSVVLGNLELGGVKEVKSFFNF